MAQEVSQVHAFISHIPWQCLERMCVKSPLHKAISQTRIVVPRFW